MAIFKECMHCVNTPSHSQIFLHLFQFAGEIHFLYQILTCINSLKITYIPMI